MASITTEARDSLVALYIAMFDGAPGATNLSTMVQSYESGKTLKQIAEDFDNTDFRSQYPAFLTAEEFADRLIERLLGDDVGAGPKAWATNWIQAKLNSGTSDTDVIVQAINALRATDNPNYSTAQATVANKVEVANYYSITLELSGELSTLQSVVSSVTSDAATVTSAKESADSSAAAALAQTFNLTTSVDNLTGGKGVDTFLGTVDETTATNNTYSISDVLNGGAGSSDILQISVSSIGGARSYAPALLSNIEKIRVINSDGTDKVTFNAASVSGLTSIEAQSSTAAIDFTNLAAGTKLLSTANGDDGDIDFQFKSAATTGDADSFDLTLSSSSGDAYINSNGAGFESGTITVIGTNSGGRYVGAAANLKTVTVKGEGSLVVNTSDMTSVTKFDASENSGGVTFDSQGANSTLMGGSGNDTLTEGSGNDIITGGAGDDTLTGGGGNDSIDGGAGNDRVVASTVTKEDTISGGEGTDVLSLSSAISYSDTTNDGVNVTGFETLRNGGGFTQNMKGLAENTITAFEFGAAGTVVLQEAATAITTVTAKDNAGTLTLGLATDGDADEMTIALGSTGGTRSMTLNAIDYETINVSSTGTDNNTLTLDNASAGTSAAAGKDDGGVADYTTINITGDKDFTLTATDAKLTGIKTVDASAYTGGDLVVNISGSDADATITASGAYDATLTGGDGADTITVGDGGADGSINITGGKGNDTIVSGGANDTISGGSGADSITSGAGNDSITSSDGSDYIDMGAGNDTISLAGDSSTEDDGNDTVIGGDGNDTVSAGGAGNDNIDMGAGNDSALGGAGNDTLIGGTGNDTLKGEAGDDSIDGGDGNDTIEDGAGNDTVLGGAGNDTLTISTGSDSVNGGDGNDTITISGLSAADTIDGGAGTDTLTVSNSSAATITPSFSNIESFTAVSSTDFKLDLTNATDAASLSTFNISSGVTTSGSTKITLTAVPTGSTITVSEDTSWDGASSTDTDDTGDVTAVTIDTVAGATVTLVVDADKDALTPTDTDLGADGLTFTDAASITLKSTGGSSSNPLDHDMVELNLDTADTTSVSIVAQDYTGLDIGDVLTSAALETFSFTSAVGADSDMTALATATALRSLTLTATGSNSTLNATTIGNTVTAVLEDLTVKATEGAATAVGNITSTGAVAMTSVTLEASGTNADLSLDDVNLGTSDITTLNLTIGDNAELIVSGGAKGVLTADEITTANVSIGSNSTIGTNDQFEIDAQTKTLNLTVGSNVTWTNKLIFNTDDTNTETLNLTLNTGSAAVDYAVATADQLKIGGTAAIDLDETDFETFNVTFNGTGQIKFDASESTTKLTVTGKTGDDSLVGGSGNDSLTGGAGNDTLTGNNGDNTLTGGDGNDNITAGTGHDSLVAGNGQDTVTAGSGNDYIDVSEDTQSADTVSITNGGTAKVTASGSGDDTGRDTINGYDANFDSLTVIATGVVNYTHATNTLYGVSTGGTATSTGANTEFGADVLILDFNADGDGSDDDIDLVINMTNLKNNGVAVAQASKESTMEGELQYNLTGTSAANTIVGGTKADTLNGGAGADSITGAAGADTIDLSADTDADVVLYTAITDGGTAGTDGGGDTVANFVAANDAIEFEGDIQTALDDVGTANATFAFMSAADEDGAAAEAVNITATHEGIFFDQAENVGGSAVNKATLTDISAVVTFLNANLTITAASGGDALIILESSDQAGDFGIYYYLEDGTTTTTISDSELRLLGVVTGDDVTTADFIMDA